MQIEKENANKRKIYNKHANKKSKTQIRKKNGSNQKEAKGRSSGKPPRLVFSIQMLARLAHLRLLRHALPISLLILRKNPTVLQSKNRSKVINWTLFSSWISKPSYCWFP